MGSRRERCGRKDMEEGRDGYAKEQGGKIRERKKEKKDKGRFLERSGVLCILDKY